MKVILLKDVPKLGKKYDVKDVSDGHASNMLIPSGAVKIATPSELAKLEGLKAVMEAERKVQEDLIAKNLHEIEGKEVTMTVKASDKGHLFAAIHTPEIVAAIKEATGADVLESFISLDHGIKETGTHTIEIKVGGKKASVKLVVEAR